MQNRGPKPARDGTVPASHLLGNCPKQALVQILGGLIDLYQTALAGTYLTFQAGGETCGLRVPQVVSVALFPNIRPLPGAPRYVLGTVSENGSEIPVVDLRLQLQMRLPASPAQDQKHLVIAYVKRSEGGLQLVGVVVDRVDVLVKYAPEEIMPGPQSPMSISPDFVLGQAVKNGQSVTLLMLDHIIPPALVSRLMGNVIPTNSDTSIFRPAETMSSFECN